MTNEILQFLKYLIESNSPIVQIPAVISFSAILFLFIRRFITTDYIAENKESREQLKQCNETLSQENDRYRNTITELEKENSKLKQENEQLRVDNHILEDRFDE